jgi:hypothetical protein
MFPQGACVPGIRQQMLEHHAMRFEESYLDFPAAVGSGAAQRSDSRPDARQAGKRQNSDHQGSGDERPAQKNQLPANGHIFQVRLPLYEILIGQEGDY